VEEHGYMPEECSLVERACKMAVEYLSGEDGYVELKYSASGGVWLYAIGMWF